MISNFKRQHLINRVKRSSLLFFPKEELKALVKTLKSDEYQEYYQVKYELRENIDYYSVYVKKNIGKREIFVFEVICFDNSKDGMVKYKYGGDITKDCLILKWMCDLLGDKHYIKQYI